jgi:hypothetical protein
MAASTGRGSEAMGARRGGRSGGLLGAAFGSLAGLAALCALGAAGALAQPAAPVASGAPATSSAPSTSPSAAPSAAPSTPARDALKAQEDKAKADQAMKSMRFADALELYSALHAETRDPALLYNQGRALEGLGRFPEALDKIEAFARDASPTLKAKVPKLGELLDDLRKRVTSLTLRTNVDGAEVLLDGKRIGTTPLALLRVPAGKGRLELSAEGHRAAVRDVTLPGGGALDIEVKLLKRGESGVLVVKSPIAGARVKIDGIPVGAVPVEHAVRAGFHDIVVQKDGFDEASTKARVDVGENKIVEVGLSRSREIYERWWFWTGLGVLVAGGAVAGVVGALNTERAPDAGTIAPGQVRGPIVLAPPHEPTRAARAERALAPGAPSPALLFPLARF